MHIEAQLRQAAYPVAVRKVSSHIMLRDLYQPSGGTQNLHFWGYDPYIEGLKPPFFMVLGSHGSLLIHSYSVWAGPKIGISYGLRLVPPSTM